MYAVQNLDGDKFAGCFDRLELAHAAADNAANEWQENAFVMQPFEYDDDGYPIPHSDIESWSEPRKE
jgi:hypothetical protein